MPSDVIVDKLKGKEGSPVELSVYRPSEDKTFSVTVKRGVVPDGSAVRLTVSRYYTPTGRSIQKTYAQGNEDYYKRFTERYHSGEMISVDSIKVADSLKFTTPKGKIVYGGGGIVPDVFVPIGSNEEEAVARMDNLGFLSFFVFEHLDEDRNRYNQYTEEEFVNDFRVDDILFEKFMDYSVNRNLKMNFYDFEDSIKLYLKAALADQLFNENIHAKIKSSKDAMLQKVIALDNPAVKQSETEIIEANN